MTYDKPCGLAYSRLQTFAASEKALETARNWKDVRRSKKIEGSKREIELIGQKV